MISIHCLNVKGVEMNDRKYIVRKWCNKLRDKDTVCLQETKVFNFQASCINKFLWDKAIGFHSEHEKGKGGMEMLVGPKWADSIVQHGCSRCQRALWVTFKTGEDIIGISNICAPNDYKERIVLGEWCSSNLPKASWIFVGVFNMIEKGSDK